MAIHPFADAIERADLDALRAMLAEDVAFHGPFTGEFKRDREWAVKMLGDFRQVVDEITYYDELENDRMHALFFRASVKDPELELEGVDVVRTDNGLISELTVMLRPVQSLMALRQALASAHGFQPPV